MWRFLSRGVRDLKHTPSSKPVDATDKQNPCLVKKKKNCRLLEYKDWASTSFKWSKSTGKSEQSSDSRNNDHINYNHSLFEAFGWSGAIVFGWYVGQSLIRNRHYFCPKKSFEEKRKCDFKYRPLTDVVTKVVLAQPQYSSILPVQSSSSSSSSKHDSGQDIFDTSHHSNAVETYGPVTKEDNFNQIGLELLNVHKEMIAELENVRGLKLLKKKKMTDALSHFKQAFVLNHPTAAFNLAQCYENGWGTEQDYSQAVFYYEKAKSQGHVSAIFNLGLYYSRGLGGLKIDTDKANELFLLAAKLGHDEAAQITGLVNCPAPSLEDLSKMFEDQNSKSPCPTQLTEAVEMYMKANDITPDEAYHSDEPDSPLWDTFVKEIGEYNHMWQMKNDEKDRSHVIPFNF